MADHALSTTQREPAAVAATIVALVAAGIAAVVAFGVDLDETQTEAILGLTAVLAPVLAGLLIRPKVTPNAKVVEFVDTDTEPDTVVAGQASALPTGTVLPIRPGSGGTLPR